MSTNAVWIEDFCVVCVCVLDLFFIFRRFIHDVVENEKKLQ